MINEEKKSEYWNHFTDDVHKGFRPKKITDIRLKMIKETVLDDDFVWQKIIAHHHALDKTPNELEKTSPPDYTKTRADFWAFVRGKINASVNLQLTRN